MIPYYSDQWIQLYHGDMRTVLPTLAGRLPPLALIVADPPYGETSLPWDRWADGWIEQAATVARSMWVFGSMRMFGHRWPQFTGGGWKFSQDIVWEKHNGSGFHSDRFRRVHEHAVHWYLGAWSEIRHEVPTTPTAVAKTISRSQRTAHMGDIQRGDYISEDGGPLLMRSVIYARSLHGKAIHPTQKPTVVLDAMIRYGCPEKGVVLDPFAGSGSTGWAARSLGRRSILIEANERYCEAAANRLGQADSLLSALYTEPDPR